MERLTPVLTARSASVPPSPAGRVATEDEGRRLLNDTSEAKLSDKIPAGRVETPAPESSSAGGSTSRVTLDTHLDVRDNALFAASDLAEDVLRRLDLELGRKD